jgi:anti-anti-sigma factor
MDFAKEFPSSPLRSEKGFAMSARFKQICIIRAAGNVVVVNFTNSMIANDEQANDASEELISLLDGTRQKMVIDFTGMDFLTASMLEKLMNLHKKLQASRGRLELCSINTSIYAVLELTHLHHFFSIREDLTEALRLVSA